MKTLIFISLLVCGSAFAQSDVINMIAGVNNAREVAEGTFSATPYRQKEFQSIKDYFVALQDFTEEINGNTKLNRRYNSYLRSIGVKQFCSSILMTGSNWERMKANCTRNRFFLCSNDVLAFPTTKKALSGTLEEDVKAQYLNAAECQ